MECSSDIVCSVLASLHTEVISGEDYSFESDLWSFGVMLFELIHGRRPFDVASKELRSIMVRKHSVMGQQRIANARKQSAASQAEAAAHAAGALSPEPSSIKRAAGLVGSEPDLTAASSSRQPRGIPALSTRRSSEADVLAPPSVDADGHEVLTGAAAGTMSIKALFQDSGSNFRLSSRLSPATRSLLKGLLQVDVVDRLGCASLAPGELAITQLKSHEFFASVDWAAVEAKIVRDMA